MRHFTLALAAVASLAAPAAVAQTAADNSRLLQSQDRFNRALSVYRQSQSRYGYNNRNSDRMTVPRDRLENALAQYRSELDRYQSTLRNGYAYSSSSNDDSYYDPSRDYRDGGNYQERAMSNDERVYRGTDGRYYCKRTDGTTGLIVGGLAGGALGNVIDGGRSRVLGTLLGGVAGALGGRAIERGANDRSGNVTCR
jgi:Ni/Co efflux regulator RcnB